MKALARLLGLLVAGRAAWRGVGGEPGPGVPSEDLDDPRERQVPASRRSEALVAVLLVLAGLFGFAFTAIYAALSTNTQLLGASLGLALAMLAAAAIIAGKFVVPQETSVEERGPLLEEQEADEVVEMIEEGGEGVSRRKLLLGAGGLAGAGVLTATATPLASIGPALEGIHSTPWRRGIRLVDEDRTPYRASDIHIGSFYTALPEGEDWENFGAGLIVVRLPPDMIDLSPQRSGWAPEGIMAYSKICPHAGCAINLYRYPLYEPTVGNQKPAFTCPCHYSTFLPGEGGKLVFGPAGRALPQLPLMIDGQGYLRAADQFHEDIGPSWWNVHRSEI